MRLANDTSQRPVFLRCFVARARCPHCGDLLVAPDLSELIDGDKIRHHWSCDSCGCPSHTSIALVSQ
jgi:hypothetical protein